jgi:hypothetical protein
VREVGYGKYCEDAADQCLFRRRRIASQLEEQKEEILHIEQGIVHPCIEDMVLIAQVHGLVEKLLVSREKQTVQVETLKTSRQHLDDGSAFLRRVHALLSDCTGNLAASLGASFPPAKPLSSPDPAERDAVQGESAGAVEQGGEMTAEVVRVAAELEDACMELNW